ncbi:hypothetical protein BU16DRAFT_568285 [Lophium mytilinum]|uniref:Uncharacterized protein n=1 Tax=Lophium mytilinum TaxID=390894 RepID=A0A6A6Q7W9_9PEZI|nr:hypothetical protein BU16DRAFT_568285 [Lophium mytilinum]
MSNWEPAEISPRTFRGQMSLFRQTCGLSEAVVEILTNPYGRRVEFREYADYYATPVKNPRPIDYPEDTPALARAYLAMARIMFPDAIATNKRLVHEARGFGELPRKDCDLRWENLFPTREELQEIVEVSVEQLVDPKCNYNDLIQHCMNVAGVLKALDQMNTKLNAYKARNWRGLKMRHDYCRYEEDDELEEPVYYYVAIWPWGWTQDDEEANAEIMRQRRLSGLPESYDSYDDEDENDEEEQEEDDEGLEWLTVWCREHSAQTVPDSPPLPGRRNPMFGRTSPARSQTPSRARTTQRGTKAQKRARLSSSQDSRLSAQEDSNGTDESSGDWD